MFFLQEVWNMSDLTSLKDKWTQRKLWLMQIIKCFSFTLQANVEEITA